jgi:SAM-dependent methyltransferase
VLRDESYAAYYDLLYSHRNIPAEVDFIEKVLKECSLIEVRKVLDVGCGTGIHTLELARRGYTAVGVDVSPFMIEAARRKAKGVPNVEFVLADATSLNFDGEFDAAIAFYGVVSYFKDDSSLLKFFNSVRRALRRGAVFIFDTWSLIGVQSKKVYYETPFSSFRKAGSMLAIKEENWRIDFLEEVAYAEIQWSVIDLPRNEVNVFKYELTLRLFTLRELTHFLCESGFELCRTYEDYSGRPFTDNSSEIVVVARAI